ncbi:MAG: PilZ domain-containing protein [Terriglobia bacterium]
MEGPNVREFPRMVLDKRVELKVGKKRVQAKEAGNLGVGGLFLPGPEFPVGTAVHVKIATSPSVEADGVVRYCGSKDAPGVGIEFTEVPEAQRARLENLIGELTRKGAPAC